jgi:hypothetical protein
MTTMFKQSTCVALAAAALAASPCSLQAQTKPSGSEALRFFAFGTNEYVFDTGVLRGKLRAEGKSKGLSSVVHVPTGLTLDRSMGLFGHYRVFTTNRRYGVGAWDWPSHASLQLDGSIQVRWPAAPDRPFELQATYRWATPNALDVVTRVTATTNLARFESFLASYFAPDFSNSLVYVSRRLDLPGPPTLMPAAPELGTWLASPRNEAASQIIRDGRWQIQPNPVAWAMLPPLAQPLGVRRAPAAGLTALLMSPPLDCFAVCTPQQSEGHYSMYLSLFGRDFKPGESASTSARLIIDSNLSDAQIVKAYQDYLHGL